MHTYSFFYYLGLSLFAFYLNIQAVLGQTLPSPTILEVKEGDRDATLYWNSKTQTYQAAYDADKQAGISSYLVEWGKQSEGFTQKAVTPYRSHMFQPLEPGVTYMARVFHLDKRGRKSAPSQSITFQHDPSRVNAMRSRLNGFFDDMNRPMGAFSEKDWNQSYSGCISMGKVSQHINNQFHGHNVVASADCDRGIASSRLRHPFDFSNRTGTIEFDLDGSQKSRQFWYLDISPFDRKRDLSGHVSLNSTDPVQADPPFLLRILERGSRVFVQLSDDQGNLQDLPTLYRNGACGSDLAWCPQENLITQINVRKHWRIELSKTDIRIFINDIRVVDASLLTNKTPNGLPYEVAQINWLLFSYNTPKENFVLSMIHWDNFGIDAPAGYQQTTEIHNYTDGNLGTATPRSGNEFSIGMRASLNNPALSTIPIPDPIRGLSGNLPDKAELMFTLQGGSYTWTANDRIEINGSSYALPKPSSNISSFPDGELINSIRPHSVVLPIDAADLLTGNNEIKFYLSNPRILNIHIELSYPLSDAPAYTPPGSIFADHMSKLMEFRIPAATVGPGIVFSSIDGTPLYDNSFSEEHNPRPGLDLQYVLQRSVKDEIELLIEANSEAQLAATGSAKGIAYYEILLDEVVIQTLRLDEEQAVAGFLDTLTIDTRNYDDGMHELFVQAYDVDGKASSFDAFLAHAQPGEYIPVLLDFQNGSTLAVEYSSFIAYEWEGNVELRWITELELASDHFQIERSVDGQIFESIAKVWAHGAHEEYAFTDKFAPPGKIYYRLKEVEVDGSISYSDIKTVYLVPGMSLNAYPNPLGEKLAINIKLTLNEGFKLALMDMKGSMVFETQEATSSQTQFVYEIETKDMSPGIYVLKLETKERNLYEKLIKE